MLRETGLVSLLIAFTGVVVPLGLVWGTMVLVGFTPLQGFVMGTALAPTSGGMAVKLMSDSGVLQTKVGQIIVCSAMTDDVFSLVILAVCSFVQIGVSYLIFSYRGIWCLGALVSHVFRAFHECL